MKCKECKNVTTELLDNICEFCIEKRQDILSKAFVKMCENHKMKECSFCYKTKPSNEIILTYDKKSFRCKWKNECEGLAD